MRNLLAVALVALCVVPAMAWVNVDFRFVDATGDGVLDIDEVGTVEIWAEGRAQVEADTKGLYALAGNVTAEQVEGTAPSLESVAGSFAWDALFSGSFPAMPVDGPNVKGEALFNGAWGGGTYNGIASTQTAFPPTAYGKLEFVKVATYQVKGLAAGKVQLGFVGPPAGTFVNGTAPSDGTTGTGRQIGTVTGGLIEVVPEPMTMALLALGGLVVARRRSR